MALNERLGFVKEIDKLKEICRVNLLHNGARQENTAEHSWHLAMTVLTLWPYASGSPDMGKALKMALIHDIVEIDAGDTYFFDDLHNETKLEREIQAADRIFGLLPEQLSSEFHGLWLEFEEGLSDEARFVKAIDRLLPYLSHIENKGIVWKEKGMTKKKIVDRMGHIEDLCPPIWELIESSMEEAIRQGFLKNH